MMPLTPRVHRAAAPLREPEPISTSMCLLVGLIVPVVLSACESGSSETQCPAGQILVDGGCTPASS